MRRFVASLTATVVLSLCSVAPAQRPAPVTEPPAASIFGEGARPLPELPPEVTATPEKAPEAAPATAPVSEFDPFLEQQGEPAPAPAAAAAPAPKPGPAPAAEVRRIPDSVEIPEMNEPTAGFQVMTDEPAAVPPLITSPPLQYEPRVRRGETLSQQLIYERAVYRARQRMARQEARKWHGISPARPRVVHGSHSANLNQGLWVPTRGAFASPAWLRATR